MKGGVFKLNMHPREYFDGNPFLEDGKGGKRRGEAKERSKSAPSDKKPFKYSSPGKAVRLKIPLPQCLFVLFSSVETKMAALIDFPSIVKKIPMSLVRCILK